MDTATTAPSKRKAPVGHVSFVGAGPGDASLLTVRAAELLGQADIVITELPEHAALVTNDAEIVDGGFGEDGEILTVAARAKLVIKYAKTGVHVVRLIAGDPFTYATGPEEAAACSKVGIGFEVVPGLSSVTAVPAYAGVPLTTRHNREFSVLNVGDSKVDWSAHTGDQTLVLLDAVGRIGEVASGLIEAGRAATTPVAMTRVGTTTEQTTVVSTLQNIAADVKAQKMEAPAITVIGEVVDMREALSWFETKPLYGWRILVPRTKEQSAGLAARLRGFGALSEEVPTISVEPPRNPQQMDKAVRGLVEGRYEWIAFTSVNAVKAVREKFEEYGLDARAFSGLKIAAVGAKTAEAIATWGIRADLVPSGEQSARGLLEDWPPYDDLLDPINRVFLPRADIATETLVAGLIDLGWEVDDVTAYRTVRAAPPPAPTREAIKTGKFDAVMFTSSSTVRNLVGIAGKPHASTIIACIGPATAKTAEEHGLRVDVMAETPS
ncbi:MAG: bifunctional uroporphyrinogen-III C-methyltransferase/uroporphyrinogen-III synthase, partial [Kineosporiaceae bacterium]|nr:bifunctional uroporphyrinogen-III C-methyltransferase/uroporphyrinogen-III synthase [Aeromicrobium sp.]